jgi:hypothetical protein
MTHQEELLTVFNLTQEDIALNREGKLSPTQSAQIATLERSRYLSWGLLILILLFLPCPIALLMTSRIDNELEKNPCVPSEENDCKARTSDALMDCLTPCMMCVVLPIGVFVGARQYVKRSIRHTLTSSPKAWEGKLEIEQKRFRVSNYSTIPYVVMLDGKKAETIPGHAITVLQQGHRYRLYYMAKLHLIIAAEDLENTTPQ